MRNIDKQVQDRSDMKQWDKAGGARRSAQKPSWALHFWRALDGILTRLDIGKKYGIHNWKKALDVPREKWHDGDPSLEDGDDNSALGFVRQFAAHGFHHWKNALDLVDKPVGAVSEKGDDLAGNLYAFGWNVLAMIEYFIENEDMFREAFSQYHVDSPKHRQDLNIPPAVMQDLNSQAAFLKAMFDEKTYKNMHAEMEKHGCEDRRK